MKTHKDDKFEFLYTSLKMIERESNIKDELIATLEEQIELLEARIEQLLSMIDRTLESEKKD